MNTWWDILDIGKDADLRAIKRAYAKKLKTIRQDENPQEFMELREAYERALAKTANSTPQESAIPLHAISPPLLPMDTIHAHGIKDLIDQAFKVIHGPEDMNTVGAWETILSDEQLLPLGDYEVFEDELINTLLEGPKIPAVTALYIYNHFGWLEDRKAIHQHEDNLEWLAKKLGIIKQINAVRGKPP